MSWSFSAIGKKDAILKALDEEAGKQSGQCKVEFDSALPHLKALVAENFSIDPKYEPLIDIEASGSGSANTTQQLNRSCSVKITQHWKRLCV